MMNLDGFNSLFELINTFSSEQKCIEYLESIRWKGTVISPFDSTSKVYKCSNGNYWCKSTNKLFNVKHQIIFENSKVALQKWFNGYLANILTQKGHFVGSIIQRHRCNPENGMVYASTHKEMFE